MVCRMSGSCAWRLHRCTRVSLSTLPNLIRLSSRSSLQPTNHSTSNPDCAPCVAFLGTSSTKLDSCFCSILCCHYVSFTWSMSNHRPWSPISCSTVLPAGSTFIARTPAAEAAVEDLGNFSGESFHSSEVDVLGLNIVDDEEYSPPAGKGTVPLFGAPFKHGVSPNGCLPVIRRCGCPGRSSSSRRS